MRFVSIWLVVIGGVTGCSGGGIDPGDVSTIADYEKKGLGILCDYYTRCGLFSKSEVAACESWGTQSQTASAQIYSPQAAISAGRLGFDSGAAANCLNAYSQTSCDLSTLLGAETGGSCQSVLQPKVAAGGACHFDAECVHGFCHAGTGGASDACPGTCTAFIATGGTCDGDLLRCATSEFCDSTKKVCAPLPGKGQDCSQSICANGLFCQSDGTRSTCQAPAGEGASCDESFSGFTTSPCADGLFCDSSSSSATCKKRQPSGGSCNLGNSNNCQDGLACATGDASEIGVCQPLADVGQSCVNASCASDAACDPASRTCKLKGQPGDDCSNDSCGLQFYCDAATTRCAQKVPLGGACAPNTSGDNPCLVGDCDMTSQTCAPSACQ